MLIRDSIDCPVQDIVNTIKKLYWNPYDEEMKACRKMAENQVRSFRRHLGTCLKRQIFTAKQFGQFSQKENTMMTLFIWLLLLI